VNEKIITQWSPERNCMCKYLQADCGMFMTYIGKCEDKESMYYELFSPGTQKKWQQESQNIINRYNKAESMRAKA